jgi:hypothetical protein
MAMTSAKKSPGGRVNRHYRLANYLHRNCENYPTHEIGPISKILDINRGNRYLTVSSLASSKRRLPRQIRGGPSLS